MIEMRNICIPESSVGWWWWRWHGMKHALTVHIGHCKLQSEKWTDINTPGSSEFLTDNEFHMHFYSSQLLGKNSQQREHLMRVVGELPLWYRWRLARNSCFAVIYSSPSLPAWSEEKTPIDLCFWVCSTSALIFLPFLPSYFSVLISCRFLKALAYTITGQW